MQKPIVFFIRSKPQSSDIIDLNLELKRAFIGYPPFKKGVPFNPHKIKSCMFDISKDSFNADNIEDKPFHRSIVRNSNLVKDAIPDSFIIIPRPERGIYFIGKIKQFELVDNPTWIEDYKKIRYEQKLSWNDNIKYHIGDIVQSWLVEKFVDVSPYKFPGWIRYSLFGRSQIGRIYDLDENNKAYETIFKLYNEQDLDIKSKSVKDKLLQYLSPNSFEHFMSNLLLLENVKDNQIWIHIGGSGDGGIDCIGFDKNSEKVVGLAQCKLKKQSINEMKKIAENMKMKVDNIKKVYVCNFYCTEKIEDGKDLEILNQDRIIELFEKHKDSNYWKLL